MFIQHFRVSHEKPCFCPKTPNRRYGRVALPTASAGLFGPFPSCNAGCESRPALLRIGLLAACGGFHGHFFLSVHAYRTIEHGNPEPLHAPVPLTGIRTIGLRPGPCTCASHAPLHLYIQASLHPYIIMFSTPPHLCTPAPQWGGIHQHHCPGD